jgi:hypothetical protein
MLSVIHGLLYGGGSSGRATRINPAYRPSVIYGSSVLSPILVLPLNVGMLKPYKPRDIGVKSKKAKLQLL